MLASLPEPNEADSNASIENLTSRDRAHQQAIPLLPVTMPNSRRSPQSSMSSPRQEPARPSRRPTDVESNNATPESIEFSRAPIKRGLFEFSWRCGEDDRKVLLRWEEKGAVKATKLSTPSSRTSNSTTTTRAGERSSRSRRRCGWRLWLSSPTKPSR
ncbi:uncharacterized protein B0I36DRAFT_336417 [Microdochium trichocladiopsis]|uniref:Uncharacterized protein n=1 Tax=Microdochium trichocladiopsis TaxID=1682393 RepID=A0A9P8XVV4_9PEZI|nr:uncharacterized protein B0I36DRAFT_336417 [Microdochium trichocladiopsis]KAH7016026.1 hypothetical protein B0I36DRAFT_336417 [Microdochium trichocladiopsis]